MASSRGTLRNILLVPRRDLSGGIRAGHTCLVPHNGRSEYADRQDHLSYFGIDQIARHHALGALLRFNLPSHQSFARYDQSASVYQLLNDMIVRRIKIYAKVTKHRIPCRRGGEIATQMERELPEKNLQYEH